MVTHKYYVRDLTDAEIIEYELRVTNAIVDHPGKILSCCCVGFLFLLVISFGVIGIKIEDFEMMDKGDIRTKREEAVHTLRTMLDQQPIGEPVIVKAAPKQTFRSVPLAGIHMIYDGRGDNTLTVERLSFIHSVESQILSHPNYKYSCQLEYIDSVWGNKTCPGALCPFYRAEWDYTFQSSLADGMKAMCEPPYQSLPWLMWNMRIVLPGVRTPCDVVNDYLRCVTEGTLLPLLGLDLGEPPENVMKLIQLGGLQPSQFEINAFVQLAARLMFSHEDFRFLRFFFDKKFASELKFDTDPTKFHSEKIRTGLTFGGPVEVDDPAEMGGLCHEGKTEADCTAIGLHCYWSLFGGVYQDTPGCVVHQEYEVTRQADSQVNKDQKKKFGSRFAKKATELLDEADGPVDVLYIAEATIFEQFLEIMARDILLAFIAFFFVYLYIQIHTGSFLLATLGMIQVLMPFPLGYFVYSVIFQIKAFYGLSTLTVFIVLAIGADDIFVFMDSWEQSNIRPRHDNCTYMKGRFAHAWKHAGKAMFITSMTTMCAFIATMSSPLDEIGYFGLFAAILIFFDYVLVMTFFAAAVVIYHRKCEAALGCCCCGTDMLGAWCNCCTCFTTMLDMKDEKEPNCMQSKLAEAKTPEDLGTAREQLGPLLDFTNEAEEKPKISEERDILRNDKEYRRRNIVGHVLNSVGFVFYAIGFMVIASLRSNSSNYITMINLVSLGLLLFCGGMNAYRAAKDRVTQLGLSLSSETFFTKRLAPFISGTKGLGSRWYVRLIPATLLCVVWVFMVIEATKLEPSTKNDQMLPNWHPIQRFIDSMTQDFPSSQQVAVFPVAVTFGIDADDPVDRAGLDRWDINAKGSPILTNTFTKQKDLSSPAFQEAVLMFCDDVLQKSNMGVKLQRTFLGMQDQNCFMRGFKQYVTGTLNLTFPVPQAQYYALLWGYSKHQRHMAEELHIIIPPSEVHYDKTLFLFADPEQPPTGVHAYMLSFNTTLFTHGNPNSKIKEFHRNWNTLVDDFSEGRSALFLDTYVKRGESFNLNGQIMHASEAWVWMHTQDELVAGAVNGTIMSLVLATIIIMFGSLNIMIAVLVLIELLGVVGYVMGTMHLAGWELGMVESIALTILVGLSVDYVVHYAIHYTFCTVDEADTLHSERSKRVFGVVTDMGPTVLGGAATSIGASLVLLLTWIQMFYKFGVCFLCTILYSYLWSTFFFLPLLATFGPQNEFLSIRPLLGKCFPKIFPKRVARENKSIPMVEVAVKASDDNTR